MIEIGGEIEGLTEILIFVASGKIDVVNADVGSVIEFHCVRFIVDRPYAGNRRRGH